MVVHLTARLRAKAGSARADSAAGGASARYACAAQTSYGAQCRAAVSGRARPGGLVSPVLRFAGLGESAVDPARTNPGAGAAGASWDDNYRGRRVHSGVGYR
jgi:hypothetical protein